MNIFVLSRDPVLAARYHVDRHVVKMIQESAQMLSTAHRIIDGKLSTKFGKNIHLLSGERVVLDTSGKVLVQSKKAMLETHHNHPASVWVRKSASNYLWLYQLFIALSAEKEHRYPGGPNITLARFGKFLSRPPKDLADIGLTVPALCMPDEFKVRTERGTYATAASYRSYYIGAKSRLARWTNREVPEWFNLP